MNSSETRTFSVIRVHDGKAEFLADLDDSADTITIETDRFSAYAVVYKDTANGSGEGNNGSGDNNGGGDNGSSGNDNQNSNDGNHDNNNSDNSSNQNDSDINDTKPGSQKDDEPKTGYPAPLELYATLAVSGLCLFAFYILQTKRGAWQKK